MTCPPGQVVVKVTVLAQLLLESEVFYHGGNPDREGRQLIYFTKDLKAAESYVDMWNDRYGEGGSIHQAKVTIRHPAPVDVVTQAAQALGIETDMYCPASMFDGALHGYAETEQLVRDLVKQGYDGAILEDIGYGVQVEFDAYIPFSRSQIHWLT